MIATRGGKEIAPDIDQVGMPRSRMLRAKPGTCSDWSPGQLAAVLAIDPLGRVSGTNPV
jgi:hypothetical protein